MCQCVKTKSEKKNGGNHPVCFLYSCLQISCLQDTTYWTVFKSWKGAQKHKDRFAIATILVGSVEDSDAKTVVGHMPLHGNEKLVIKAIEELEKKDYTILNSQNSIIVCIEYLLLSLSLHFWLMFITIIDLIVF